MMWLWPQGRPRMQISVCLQRASIGGVLMLFCFVNVARAEMASVYGGRDGYCGSRTANGERVNCSAMTAAHRRLPFGTRVRVCHGRCVTVRINDRGPWVRVPRGGPSYWFGWHWACHYFETVKAERQIGIRYLASNRVSIEFA